MYVFKISFHLHLGSDFKILMMVVVLTIFFHFQVSTAKANYAKSLRMLEEISESIHARRQLKRKINVLREPGVGAEFEMNENMADIGNYGFLFKS